MRPSLARVLAAVMAMASPMNAGIPPLDTGRRDPRVVKLDGYDDDPVFPPTRDGGGCDLEFRGGRVIASDLVSDEERRRASRELQDKAAAKRARRAARRSR